MYVYVNNGVATQLIPDFDPVFPEVAIEDRYSESFRKRLVHVDDAANVYTGMSYNSETGEFFYPVYEPTIPAVDNSNLDELKANKIAESKTKLTEWLENNPMQFTDGKYYSVTAEKQALLNSNLASYERARDAEIPYPLKWNSTGDECTEWTYADLVSLSLAIAAYVAPKVSHQQEIELKINACETIEDLNKIEIVY